MPSRYLHTVSTAHLALAALVLTLFLIGVEVSASRELAMSRMQRDILYLSTTCPAVHGGQPLVSTILTTSPGPPGTAPASLRCIYTTSALYGRTLRSTATKNQ